MSNSTKSKESKESDREKPNAKESEKSRNNDKPEKSKRSSPNVSDSPRDDYDKGRFLNHSCIFRMFYFLLSHAFLLSETKYFIDTTSHR